MNRRRYAKPLLLICHLAPCTPLAASIVDDPTFDTEEATEDEEGQHAAWAKPVDLWEMTDEE